MRTKTLLTAAAALAVGLIASQTQAQVYSQNIVGYVNVAAQSGFTVMANPLNLDSTNSAVNVLSNLPDLSTIYIWEGTSYKTYGYFGGEYYDPTFTDAEPAPDLLPGQAFFVQSPSAFTNTFTGAVAVNIGATNSMVLNTGFNFVAPVIPEAGGVTSVLGLNPPDLTTIYLWDGNSFKSYGFYEGQWYDPTFNNTVSEPTLKAGEGFFLQLPSSYTWTMTLTNN